MPDQKKMPIEEFALLCLMSKCHHEELGAELVYVRQLNKESNDPTFSKTAPYREYHKKRMMEIMLAAGYPEKESEEAVMKLYDRYTHPTFQDTLVRKNWDEKRAHKLVREICHIEE